NPRFKRLRKKMLDDYGKERFIAHQKASQKRSNRIESLRNFKKPILYTISTDDKLFSLKEQKENLHGISDVTYKEIKESGHMMPVEQANELAHTIEDWINERIFNSMNMITQVEFNAEGDILRGEMYFPTDSYEEKLPTIVMFHGFAALKEMYTDDIAKQFAKNGYVVFLFDNRNFGESDGQPRQEINPWQQIEDYRHVITYATTYDFVDEERIGIWGTSLSGGHTLVVSAIDRRVKCVVSVVPTISGYENGLRRGSPDSRDKLQKYLMKDRKKRLMGESPSTMPVVPEK